MSGERGSRDGDISRILECVAAGEPGAADRLLARVYDELRVLASARLAGERRGHTLQATALVHEAWLRLFGDGAGGFANRAHFFGAAGEAMRRILVDHARRRLAARRGGGAVRADIAAEDRAVLGADAEEIVAVHEALLRMEDRQPRAASVVRLRFFAGFELPEIAEALGLSLRTVEREWAWARARLHRDLT